MPNPLARWPVFRQLLGDDRSGRGAAVRSPETDHVAEGNRIESADRVVQSICPYCGVGCGQQVFVRNEKVVQIEGDPDSPISRGRLCPKGSATLQLTTGGSRLHRCLYRRPGAADWEVIDLDRAMDLVAERIIATRRDTWEQEHEGRTVARTMGIASLGGATLDNEENYLIKKLWTALGIVQVENQARVCHSSTVIGLGASFGRGGSTTFMQDLQHSDCIVVQGSNFAECHPVGFQWVMEAKARGATLIHVDPRFTRTSALADLHVPLRAGTDIAFLGAIINHVLTNDLWFGDYVANYTNASTIISEDFVDTEDLDGLFSGFDEEGRRYDQSSWQYEGEDPTLAHPRCVLQILKRHFTRYTPEMVQEVCGVAPDTFAEVCRLVTERSGPEHTTAFAYAVGWTQHTVGVQYIRTASILQLLLGNIGRPGGGIMALRGHASIQGSSDIPTLYDLLPGYLKMPSADEHPDLDAWVKVDEGEKGFWGATRAYGVSLLKAYWGDAATAENDFCYDHLPKITGHHGTYDTVLLQQDGVGKGYILLGQNPAVGSANAKAQRLGMAKLDWLVVRDFSLIESATWWKDGPEIETGEMRTADIDTEVFFFPAAAHTEKSGSFTNTNRWVQWHEAAVEPTGDSRSDLWWMYHIGQRIRAKLADSTDPRDRPLLDLTWDYPVEGPLDEPSAEAVLAEINGFSATGAPLSGYAELADDGSTSCGCWIYSGCYADGVNQTARKKPWTEQSWVAPEWAWAWPANRRVLYNRASADPDGNPWSERKALVWWDPDAGEWTGHDVPDFIVDRAPDHEPAVGATGADALGGCDPFIMQGDGKGRLFAPDGVVDGPLPVHYEPQDSPVRNAVHGQQRNPTREVASRPSNRYHPDPQEAGGGVYPFVVTTYRLTEHFTAGSMTRTLPYLAELQPEMFCEISPELADLRGLTHNGWATVVTARGAIEARVMVTDRMGPLLVGGRPLYQIGLPYHWGPNGLSSGDAANELTAISLDPNAHIQEVKALSADIVPGRRPRGPALPVFVEQYRERAGITEQTGVAP